jgi:hypothetical protein
MNSARRQRGQLIVAGIVLIVVVALMISTLGFLYVSNQSSGILHNSSGRAYYAARSGIEFSSGQYFNGSGCSSLNNSNVAVGNGTLTLTPTLFAPLAPTATTAALTAASTSIPVTSTAGYALHGRLLIDSELINYTSTTGTTFDGLTRGVGGTTAAAHATGATVSQNVCLIRSSGTAGGATRIVEAALGAGTTASPGALGTMGVDAMVVYAKGTTVTGAGSDRNVYYRLWDGTGNAGLGDWGAEQTSTQQVSANSSPVFFTVQFARTRNEAIMAVLDGNRNLYLHVWNGISWSNPRGAGVALSTPSTNLTRNVQIAYEYASDRALIVYQNNTSNPQYATWNGATLTLAGNVLNPYPVSGSNGAQCGTDLATNAIPVHLWFRLAPRNVAGSNDMLMMSMDCKQDTYGMRWTGAAWNNMGDNARWDTTISDATNREAIDVAWQSNGTLAVFAAGDATARQIGYRTWNATTSTLTPTGNGSANSTIQLTFPGTCASAIYEWVRLYPDPNNNILAMMQTANRCLVSTPWGGGAFFGTVTVHDGTNTVESAASRSFDFAWEKRPTSSGSGWVLWGSGTSVGIRTKYFTSPATWGAASTFRDRNLLLQAGALSPSGRFVTGAYQSSASATDDIESVTTTGGGTAWPNAATTLWTGATSVQQGERVFVVTREGNRINTGASGTGVVSVLQAQEPP